MQRVFSPLETNPIIQSIGGEFMSWYEMHECICIACRDAFQSVEKMNVCLPCFEAQLANGDK
jgi:hypothetical protein